MDLATIGNAGYSFGIGQEQMRAQAESQQKLALEKQQEDMNKLKLFAEKKQIDADQRFEDGMGQLANLVQKEPSMLNNARGMLEQQELVAVKAKNWDKAEKITAQIENFDNKKVQMEEIAVQREFTNQLAISKQADLEAIRAHQAKPKTIIADGKTWVRDIDNPDEGTRNKFDSEYRLEGEHPSGGSGSKSGGYKFAALTPLQQDAIDKALSRGLLDPNKLNSRTATMWADQFIKNPNLDENKLSSASKLMGNPAFMNRAITLETLPEVMKNMVEAGKKVNYSDVRYIGKLEELKNGQLNDPDFINYMTQRNDAMMTIAAAMRSVGMSDKAIEQEIKAAPETMSPRALEGWLSGQMKALEPRLRKMQQFTRSDQDHKPEEKRQKEPGVIKQSELPVGFKPL